MGQDHVDQHDSHHTICQVVHRVLSEVDHKSGEHHNHPRVDELEHREGSCEADTLFGHSLQSLLLSHELQQLPQESIEECHSQGEHNVDVLNVGGVRELHLVVFEEGLGDETSQQQQQDEELPHQSPAHIPIVGYPTVLPINIIWLWGYLNTDSLPFHLIFGVREVNGPEECQYFLPSLWLGDEIILRALHLESHYRKGSHLGRLWIVFWLELGLLAHTLLEAGDVPLLRLDDLPQGVRDNNFLNFQIVGGFPFPVGEFLPSIVNHLFDIPLIVFGWESPNNDGEVAGEIDVMVRFGLEAR